MQDVFFVSNTRPKTEDCADFEQHPKFEHSLANGIPARQFNKRALQIFFSQGKPKNEYGLFFNEGGLWSYANTNIFKTTFVTCKILTERRKLENTKATIGGKIRKILSNEP